jgi:DNA-directed RNA polymerase specialized sigma24 family protein
MTTDDVQNTFIKVFQHLKKFKGESKLFMDVSHRHKRSD